MTYTHGHHASVLRSHMWRTADNSCAYLLPHLRAGMSVLDVGCGPGTITLDLARLVAPGHVLGLDASAEVIEQARARAGAETSGVRFEVGDIFALDLPDAAFDVVHAHQVLQHVADPAAALVALRRVLRPGGLLAVRDTDYGALTWAPADPVLERWRQLYLQVTSKNGHCATIGPFLLGLAQRAGFDQVATSSSCWTFADPESRAWWGTLWADRVRLSRLAEQAVAYGLSDAAELERMARHFMAWAAAPDGVFIVPHVEILARR